MTWMQSFHAPTSPLGLFRGMWSLSGCLASIRSTAQSLARCFRERLSPALRSLIRAVDASARRRPAIAVAKPDHLPDDRGDQQHRVGYGKHPIAKQRAVDEKKLGGRHLPDEVASRLGRRALQKERLKRASQSNQETRPRPPDNLLQPAVMAYFVAFVFFGCDALE